VLYDNITLIPSKSVRLFTRDDMPVPKVNVRRMVTLRSLCNISVSFSANAGFKPRYKLQGIATIFHFISLLFVM